MYDDASTMTRVVGIIEDGPRRERVLVVVARAARDVVETIDVDVVVASRASRARGGGARARRDRFPSERTVARAMDARRRATETTGTRETRADGTGVVVARERWKSFARARGERRGERGGGGRAGTGTAAGARGGEFETTSAPEVAEDERRGRG